jgi:hypothetical protein
MVRETDDELPWDPIWAYVLGEEDVKSGGFRQKKKVVPQEEGILSYIKDIMPVTESRDDKWSHERTDDKITNDDSKKKGLIWRRNSRTVESVPDEAWEWHISTGSSNDEVLRGISQPTRITEPTRDNPPTKEKRNIIPRRNSRPIDTKSTDSWEWRLTTGSERDDLNPLMKTLSKDSSPAIKGRSTRFSSPFRKKNDNDSWDWQFSNGKKEKRSFVRRFSVEKETDKWDFISVTNQDKGPRRVRFIRSSSNKDEAWIDTEEVVAQLERSQNTLFDWVGINPSFEEDESKDSKGKSLTSPFNKSRKAVVTPHSDSNDIFGGLFGWESSSEDESSFQSSAEESSAYTIEEDAGSDDDSRSVPTLASDTSQSVQQDDNDLNEVRLSFQPVPVHGERSMEQMPKIEEVSSRDESPRDIDDISATDSVSVHDPPIAEKVVEEIKSSDVIDEYYQSGSGSMDQPRIAGRGICCSVKNLSSEQLKWSAESGIPFHELSPEEKSRLFPKKRAVSETGNYVSSADLVYPQTSNRSIHDEQQTSVPLSTGSPLSFFEYEYKTGTHMYVSYDRFGDDSMRLVTGPTPVLTSSAKDEMFSDMLVLVEVR